MSSEPPNFRPKGLFGPQAPAPEAQKPHAAAPVQAPAPVAPAGQSFAEPKQPAQPIALPGPLDKALSTVPIHVDEPWWRSLRASLGVSLVLAALPPAYWVLTSTAFRATGFGGVVGLWLALVSLLAAGARFTLDRSHPRDLTLAAVSAGAGSLALSYAGVMAHRLRGEADAIILSNEVHEPGMREFLITEAHGNGRLCALIALIGLPGALLGGLSLALVLGARRVAKDAPEREAPVWVMLALSALGLVVGFVTSAWAAVLPVGDAKNPREARVVEVAEAFARNDMKAACGELEAVIAPSFVAVEILERELPQRVELAHRCITVRIDELPLGRACDPASEKLLATETVKLAKAQERVRQACKGR